MSKKTLVQIGDMMYELKPAFKIYTPKELDKALDEYNVRQLKEESK